MTNEQTQNGLSSNSLPDKGSVREFVQTKDKQLVSIGKLSIHRPDLPPRLIVNSNLYHRDTTSKVKSNPSRFVRILKGNDDPYIRRMIVGEEWIPVDTAWIKQIGYLRIRNEGGKPFNSVPSQEQIQEEMSRILDIGYLLNLPEKEDKIHKTRRTMFDPPLEIQPIKVDITSMWMIHPYEHMEGKPHPTFPMFMRCRHGEVSVTIIALPD